MLTENKKLENSLRLAREVIPAPVFNLARPVYHWALAWAGAIIYGFPSRSMKVVGVTGTKGKSTTVFCWLKYLKKREKRWR